MRAWVASRRQGWCSLGRGLAFAYAWPVACLGWLDILRGRAAVGIVRFGAFQAMIRPTIDRVSPRVLRRSEGLSDLVRLASDLVWRRELREREGRKKEMGEKREKEKCIIFRVFKTRIYTLCDFSKRSFIFTYFK